MYQYLIYTHFELKDKEHIPEAIKHSMEEINLTYISSRCSFAKLEVIHALIFYFIREFEWIYNTVY